MKDDTDIEDVLRRFRSDPGSRVKRSVLSRFTHTYGGKGSHSFWRRPIPLYLASAVIIIAVALSFLAGQRMPPPGRYLGVLHESPRETNAAATLELEWEIAPNDLL